MSNYELLQNRLSSAHLPALDGLRFIAVFLVIFYHSGLPYVPGGHGVMLFFVLSGFLITWLLLKENEKTGTISLKGFFKRRVLRIFPAFYAYAFVTILMLLATKKNVPWTHAFTSFFYFSNYYSAFHPESNNAFSHTWSLAVEEQFYLFFPFLFLIFCRNLKQLTIALGVLIVSTWLWRCILVFGFGANGGYIYSAFDTRLDHLLVGCLLAVILRRKIWHTLWDAVLKYRFVPFLTLILITFSVYLSHTNETYKSTFGFTIEPILMAVFIAQAVTFSAQGFWQWLDYKPIKFLGALSYSLYLYQQLTTWFVPTRLADFPIFVQLSVTVLVTITVAALSYYLIETPFLELKTMTLGEVLSYNRLKLKALFDRSETSNQALTGFLAQQKRKAKSAEDSRLAREKR